LEWPRGDPGHGVPPGGCWIGVLPCRALSCGCHRLPTGLEDVSKYPALVAELLARNWTEQEVSAALANNLLRVFKRVETVSEAQGGTGQYGNGWGKGMHWAWGCARHQDALGCGQMGREDPWGSGENGHVGRTGDMQCRGLSSSTEMHKVMQTHPGPAGEGVPAGHTAPRGAHRPGAAGRAALLQHYTPGGTTPWIGSGSKGVALQEHSLLLSLGEHDVSSQVLLLSWGIRKLLSFFIWRRRNIIYI